MPDMPIVDSSANELAPPSADGLKAQELLASMGLFSHDTSYQLRVEAAKAHAMLDLADAIRNS